ncbi:hypothetical protein ACNHOZ_27705 [Priestia sp. D51]
MSYTENEQEIISLINNEEENPVHLKSSKSAEIGESRTFNLLIENNLWVLRRYIDKNGADFVIHRGSLKRDLLHINPPSIGFVQSKYVSDPNTPIAIDTKHLYNVFRNDRQEYQLSPKPGYFLIIHNDYDNKPRQFCLTAEEILSRYKSGDLKDVKTVSGNEVTKVEIKLTINQLLKQNENPTYPKLNLNGQDEEDIADKIHEELKSKNYTVDMDMKKLLGERPLEDDDFDGDWSESVKRSFNLTKQRAYDLLSYSSAFFFALREILHYYSPDEFKEEEEKEKILTIIRQSVDRFSSPNWKEMHSDLEKAIEKTFEELDENKEK